MRPKKQQTFATDYIHPTPKVFSAHQNTRSKTKIIRQWIGIRKWDVLISFNYFLRLWKLARLYWLYCFFRWYRYQKSICGRTWMENIELSMIFTRKLIHNEKEEVRVPIWSLIPIRNGDKKISEKRISEIFQILDWPSRLLGQREKLRNRQTN